MDKKHMTETMTPALSSVGPKTKGISLIAPETMLLLLFDGKQATGDGKGEYQPKYRC